MLRRQFHALVRQVFRDLPPAVLDRLDNVDIVVKLRPSPADLRRGRGSAGTLFGLYRGVPLAQRGGYYNLALPDQIIIYQEAHERYTTSQQEMVEQIRKTLLHEIAHHMGIGESEMRRLGLA